VRVHSLDTLPGLVAVCAGYEQQRWRGPALARHMIEWLPDFALRDSERRSMDAATSARLLGRAARTIYASTNNNKRGEPGELLLHILLRQVFKTTPAISKIFFKDSSNDTVKGFDAVHVVTTEHTCELWLGEVKFYSDIQDALSAVITELRQHLASDYLRREFAAITNKIDPSWPHAARLLRLLDPNTSLDTIFDALCIPVLLTYDSPVLAAHTRISQAFLRAFEAEVRKHHAAFASHELPPAIRVHLLLLPMNCKEILVREFNAILTGLQALP
jgi:hypothetical protein